jgi:hypothetical protein
VPDVQRQEGRSVTYVLTCDRTFHETGLRLAGKDAALLHAVALHECASVDGNGVLPPMTVKDAANLFDLKSPAKLAARLVEHGVWHDADGLAGCDDCLERTDELGPGELLIHRWWEPLLHSEGKHDPVKRSREQRRKALNRNRALVLKIRTRDQDLCRYCGAGPLDPSGPDRRSPLSFTLDHRDPWGGNTEANVVVACRRCNGLKRDRTPEEAEMTLLRPGSRAGSDPAPTEHGAGPSLAGAHETGRSQVGPGRDGAGSGPEPEREPAPDLSYWHPNHAVAMPPTEDPHG